MTPFALTELGTERRCNACREWWPLDEEFFYRQRNGFHGFQATCKACKATQRGSGDSRKGRGINREIIREALSYGRHPRDISAQLGCSVRLVYRVKALASGREGATMNASDPGRTSGRDGSCGLNTAVPPAA